MTPDLCGPDDLYMTPGIVLLFLISFSQDHRLSPEKWGEHRTMRAGLVILKVKVRPGGAWEGGSRCAG